MVKCKCESSKHFSGFSQQSAPGSFSTPPRLPALRCRYNSKVEIELKPSQLYKIGSFEAHSRLKVLEMRIISVKEQMWHLDSNHFNTKASYRPLSPAL